MRESVSSYSLRLALIIGMVCLSSAAITSLLAGQGREKKREDRANLSYAELPDGSELSIVTRPEKSPADEKVSDVVVHYYGKRVSERWDANNVTSVHRVPESDRYYALLKVVDDRLFIFFLWNGHHCTLDRKTGAILASGDGDDELKKYDELVPLKLGTTVSGAFQFGPYKAIGARKKSTATEGNKATPRGT